MKNKSLIVSFILGMSIGLLSFLLEKIGIESIKLRTIILIVYGTAIFYFKDKFYKK